MKLPADVGRVILVAYAAFALMAARGLQLRADAGAEALWPHLWGPLYLGLAVLLLVHAVALRDPVACLITGGALHALLLGRLVGAWYNDRAGLVAVPGSTLTAVAFYAPTLFATSLVWRFLLWPITRRR